MRRGLSGRSHRHRRRKAKLLSDDYCDGLGNCLPYVRQTPFPLLKGNGSLREAAVEANMKAKVKNSIRTNIEANTQTSSTPEKNFTGCPGNMAKKIFRSPRKKEQTQTQPDIPAESELRQWPVQIKLVPVNAPYFNGAHLLIAADCTAYACANFHQEFIRNRITLIGCPKLDEGDYSEKLTEIIRQNDIKSVTIVRMEVPCCGGLARAARNSSEKQRKIHSMAD